MTKLVWDQIGERKFEAGLDRGVLYTPGGTGVPWNGLTSFEEKTTDKVDAVYYDGVKINDIVTLGDFAGTLNAITYPDEFAQFEGMLEDETGMFLMGQPLRRFHLSYRTKIGNDVDGLDLGYKIHLLYNLTAIPSQRSNQTLSIGVNPMEFQWAISAIPESIEGYRPTAHLVIDTRDMDEYLVTDIEDILYGDAERAPRMPSLKVITSFIRKWDRIIITDNGDGTWTAESPLSGLVEMLDTTTFQINNANAVYLDEDTYEISSSEKVEEDI